MRLPALKSLSTWPTRRRSTTRSRWISSRRRAELRFGRSGRRHPASRRSLRRRNRAPAGQRLFPRQTRSGEAHQELRHSVHDRPCHPILRVPARYRESAVAGATVHLPHALFQPMAADDVATAVAAAALAQPVNGTIEIAGPDALRMDEVVGKVLAYDKSPLTVIRDPEARYFGLRLTDQSLVPGSSPRLGSTRFDWWLTTSRRRRAGRRPVAGDFAISARRPSRQTHDIQPIVLVSCAPSMKAGWRR